LEEKMPNVANRRISFSAALGQRFDNRLLLSGAVKPDGVEITFPEVTVAASGAPNPFFSALARDHPWDIGEQAFSTYLMARDIGKEWTALPIFPSRFFPHTGLWINRDSGIHSPADLVGKRVGCGSFGTNFSVWCRGALTHQYDVPIERITWVESAEEHISEFRVPRRYTTERIEGQAEPAAILSQGKVDAACLPGPARRTDESVAIPLFDDVYGEMAGYLASGGAFPINTVITVRNDAVAANPDMPRVLLQAYLTANEQYQAQVAAGNEPAHMGLEADQLISRLGIGLPKHGFAANRGSIRTMLGYCYEQGITRRLREPEDVFLLTDS